MIVNQDVVIYILLVPALFDDCMQETCIKSFTKEDLLLIRCKSFRCLALWLYHLFHFTSVFDLVLGRIENFQKLLAHAASTLCL